MKKQLLSVSLISVCLLCSCAQTPDNIEGNKNVGSDENVKKVSVEHILDDFDKAFETKYTKFKLPEKSSVVINQPEEVCDLELKYVNAEKDVEWMKNKVNELADIFKVSKDGKIDNIDNAQFFYKTKEQEVCVLLFSNPYYMLTNNYDLNAMVTQSSEYLDRTSYDNIKKEYNNVLDNSFQLVNKIKITMEDELDKMPKNLYIKEYNDKKFYQLCFQQFFKGVGIQYIYPTYPKENMTGDNDIFSAGMYCNLLYDSDLNLIYYIGCDSFTPINEEPLDKIISFKGACDILEKELASNISLELDDVKLWYEPRGEYIDLSDPSIPTYDAHDGSKTIKCTPKWFFISDNEDSQYTANYITVDCVTGEIEVFLP